MAGAFNSPQLLMLSGVGPRRTPHDARNRGASRPARGGREPLRPPGQLARVDDARAREPAARARAGGACRVRSSQTGPFASNLAEAGGFARVGAGAPAPDMQFHVAPRPHHRRGHGRPPGARRLGLALPAHAAQPRQRATGLQGPDGEADHPQRLLHRRRGHAADDRRAAADAGDLRPAGAAAVLRRRRSTSRTATPRRRCVRTSRAPRSRSTTRSAPAAWAATRRRSSTSSCA